jgi:hypothetical protein
MKKDKDRQVGVRVGLPVFFALELEDVYRHGEGAHRALAFSDFVGLLVGMGLEAYRKEKKPRPVTHEYPKDSDIEYTDLFNTDPEGFQSRRGEYEKI